ncbi:hypothetical protein J4573_14700 [Actinomadura barringtoniae]|uniref:Uncharacterized protein n=1 Tax=Actinomadura barringtoniae TaxID=1427535 RepID=A0A939PA54_9ACTN|nr:hypothetical protein [Actinomadura barringtoniae]MBO2448352.1 hypothetical protein [Actinomadura barringtoniae]
MRTKLLTLTTALASALTAGILPAAAHASDVPFLECPAGEVNVKVSPGLTFLPQNHDLHYFRHEVSGCRVLRSWGVPGWEVGTVHNGVMDYHADGRGGCPFGLDSIVDRGTVDLAWDDGHVTTLSVQPYSAGPLKTGHVDGTVVKGLGKGGRFDSTFTLGNAVSQAPLCVFPGISEIKATTDYVKVWDIPTAAAPAQPPSNGYPPEQPNLASGDGTTPTRKTLVPAMRPYGVSIVVRNSGRTQLQDITAVDATANPNAKLAGVYCQARALAPGQITKCGGTVTVPAGIGMNTSTFVVKATSPEGVAVSVQKNIYTYTG